MCGKCCRKIIIMDDDGKWLKREKDFRRLCRDHSDYQRFVIHGESEEGLLMFDCTLQNVDNSCSQHDSRMNLCRRFPTEVVYYRGGDLLPECGYRFVEWRFRDAFRRLMGIAPLDFDTVLENELSRMDDGKKDT